MNMPPGIHKGESFNRANLVGMPDRNNFAQHGLRRAVLSARQFYRALDRGLTDVPSGHDVPNLNGGEHTRMVVSLLSVGLHLKVSDILPLLLKD